MCAIRYCSSAINMLSIIYMKMSVHWLYCKQNAQRIMCDIFPSKRFLICFQLQEEKVGVDQKPLTCQDAYVCKKLHYRNIFISEETIYKIQKCLLLPLFSLFFIWHASIKTFGYKHITLQIVLSFTWIVSFNKHWIFISSLSVHRIGFLWGSNYFCSKGYRGKVPSNKETV